MHERSLVAEAAWTFLRRAGFTTPRLVVVTIGPGMDPEAARAAWTETTAGTPLSEAPVGWREASDRLRCLDCGADYRGEKLDPCPVCGADGLVVEAAPAIEVEEVS